MLLHEFGEDLVFALELFLEGSDLLVLGILGGLAGFAGWLEGGGTVVEELLLPEIEEVDGEGVLFTDVGDGLLLQEVEAQDGDLLLRGKMATSLLSHEFSSARVLPLTPSKANSSSG
jgi:hypothetical protein